MLPDQPRIDPRTLPIGRYAGNPPLPMTPGVALTDQHFARMLGATGELLAGAPNAAGGRYFGTDAVPAPVYPRGRINRDVDLEVAPIEATGVGR